MTSVPPDIAPEEENTKIFVLRRDWLLAAIVASCVLVEAVLIVADLGTLSIPRLRQRAYEYGGFWPGLLGNWGPNYALQPYLMFVTYGFLHGGFIHITVNMITLWSLGRAVTDRVGKKAFAFLYAASLLGGAIGYGLIASNLRPMVGASGALFGLVGALLAWNYVDRFTLQERLWPVARSIVLLLLLNVVLWWAMDKQLAWETHLGGFLAGWVTALLIDPRGRA